MKNYFKSKAKAFINDKIVFYSILLSIALLGLHIYQFINSNFRVEPLIRVVFFGVFIPAVFFGGRKFIPYLFYILALAIGLTIEFNNYTPFFIVALVCFLIPKAEIPFLIFYAIDILIVCTLHHKTPIHLIIHFLNCAFIYSALKIIVRDRAKKKPLNLTDDERAILEELRLGKQQKEIELFSKNTITKKLRDARNRNDIPTTDELLIRYIASLV